MAWSGFYQAGPSFHPPVTLHRSDIIHLTPNHYNGSIRKRQAMDMLNQVPDSSPVPEGTDTKQVRPAWIYVILASWLVLIAGLLWFSLRQPQQWFDPAQIAPHPFNNTDTLAQFKTALITLQPDLSFSRPVFIRFTQAGCSCEKLVDAYHQLQTPLLQQQGYQVLTLDRAQLDRMHTSLPQLWQWISATPAVMVLDAQGGLAYFGPYHQEGVCNSENSYLEPVLQAVTDRQPVNILNTLVFGCFCSTDTTTP